MSKIYIGIDPGDKNTAMVRIDSEGNVLNHDLVSNLELIPLLEDLMVFSESPPRVGIEMIASYGMPVGKTVFETCVFIGRLVQILQKYQTQPRAIYRKDAKMNLCYSMKANDSNVRQAIIDLYPATGGGKNPVVGIKSNPGPLFGFAKDKWAALAVALVAKDKWEQFETFQSWMKEGL